MGHFVNIASVFSAAEDRTLSALMAVYQNAALLEASIKEVMKNGFDEKNIQDKKVLLKPNWVKHSLVENDEWCLRTHDQILLAILKIVLELKPQSVLIGDAPIQGCHWDKVITKGLKDQISGLSNEYGIPVSIKDFRRVTFEPSKNNPEGERNPITDYLIFDLGNESYLEPITRSDKKQFRVTNYDPDRLAESHGPGVHKYCITRELFDADVVISLPKVKTHQKAGITAALKNIVGLNGDKDFLPHHRLGGTGFGGDCYPGKNYLRYLSELSIDFANRRQGRFSYWLGCKTSSLLWKLSLPEKEHQPAAGWHGNDTTWRMVLDLNKIVICGKADGSLTKEPQRQLFSLSDGIIGGQGDGPLNPDPLPLGIISFTNHAGMHDLAMAKLMGFEVDKIPLLKTAAILSKKDKFHMTWNGAKVTLNDLKKQAVKTTPPSGWVNYLK